MLTVIIPLPMDHKTPLQPTLTSTASGAGRSRWFAIAARTLLWLTVTVWVLFGASWGLLHGWIVPRIGEFRPRLELEAGKALGVPVRIGQITARSEGLIPSFELRDVVLLDPQGREALRLPRVLVALSPASMLARGFEQLFIDQPTLEIRRAADGKIYVGGLDVSQGRGDSNAVADWVFSQPELAIKGGVVRWVDDLRGAPPLVLSQVDGVLRNGRRSHAMRFDATPQTEWGERFSLRGTFRQPLLSVDAGHWSDWSGQLYAEFGRVDVSRINQYVRLDSFGVELKEGNGSLRAWADVSRGRVLGGTADVALVAVNARFGATLKALVLDAVQGRFGGQQLDNGFSFNTEGLRFNTPDGLRWPGGNLALIHTQEQTKNGATESNELKADKLDLAAMAQIANRLPLGTATHAAIASYDPKGLVESLDARWQGAGGTPATFAAKGRVSGLQVAALPSHQLRALPAALSASASAPAAGPTPPTVRHESPGRPGLSGATIDFDTTHAGGKAQIKIKGGYLDLPGIFEDPHVPLDTLAMDAQWSLTGAKVDVQMRDIKFSSADAAGVAQASWHSGEVKKTGAASRQGVPAVASDTSLGVLDLQGVLSRGDGARVHRYLPLVLPERVRHYVRDAVLQGEVSDVRFKVKGPVDHIPFSSPAQGDFKITAKIKKGTFAYVPKSVQPKDAAAWPAFVDLSGELVFDHASLEVNGATAKVAGLAGLQLVKVEARIPDLMHSAAVDVNAKIKGPLADAVAFVNASPLASLTGNVLGKAVAGGPADYALRLNLPLYSLDKTRVLGTVTLPGNDVQFVPASPTLARLKGLVTFNESGFNVPAAQARLLGGDVRFEGGTRVPARPGAAGLELDAGVAFKAQGTVTAEGLQQAKDIGFASRLAQNASGNTAYSASLAFRRGTVEVQLSSNLQGMALSLPAPLNKSAEAALPLRFENTLLRDSLAPGQKLQDQLALSLGRVASVVYVRDVSGSDAKVIRGSIGVGLEAGESAPLPDSGVVANINLSQVDLDAWQKVLSAASVSTGGATDAAPVAATSYLPTQMAIRARELLIDGRKLNNVVVGGSRDGQNWRANIDATELNGYVEFRQSNGSGPGRVYARLARLSLGQNTANDVENILDEQPANIPALDIVVDDFELRGKKLGRVEIDAVNRGAAAVSREGGVREWRLNKFNITLPEATLAASGNWVAVNAQAVGGVPVAGPRAPRSAPEKRRTVMNFKLDIADSGLLLKRFGMADVIRRGKGKMEGQVAWVGSPLSPDYPSMNGQFNVNIETGQFLKADPGIAKLFGVLSLQSLPRRLTLDFRDVFSEGFAFDFVRGDVGINQGLAFTNNLQMKGVNAAVLMEGSADIARETQDLKVVVVPEINAGTASLIATVINPAVGLGTFLAQYFLRRPLIQANTQEFHIDGSWTDPKITKVEKKP